MVLQRGQFYGFNGYKVPTRPRGSRSARGKRSFSKNVEESKMRAFEILATLAGKLLLEKEAPTLAVNSNAKHELQGEEKQLKVELCDQESCDEGTLTPNSHCQWLAQKIKLRECLQTSTSVVLQPANVIVKSEVPEKIAYKPVLTVVDQSKNGVRLPFETHSPDSAESHVTKAEDGTHAPLQELLTTGNDIDGTVTDLFCLEDPMDLDFKPPNLVTSDSSIGAPTDHSNPNNQDDIGVVDRDDDENSSRCTPPSTVTPKTSRPQRIGDRRIRKLLASKFWKIGPTLLRDGESFNNDAEVKPIFRSRRMCYTRRRTQRSTFSRRRLFEHSSMGTFDESITDATFKLPEKDTKGEARIAAPSMRGGQKPQLKSEDYQVKIGIRSIKVPELFIEMPETATVGELKRTVLETVTSMLRNGLRVGVILQGKKVRDDSKTLRQAGICNGVKPDSVGFSLELNSTQVLQQLINPEKPPILQQCDPYEPLSWLPASDSGVSDAIPNPTDPQVTEPMDHAQSDQNVVIRSGPSATPLSSPDKSTSNSKALVPVPSVSAESMALAPLHRKSRRPELAQRRIRRPFLVSEVEALVQAVEMLGTGRWRDVKLQAFENAKHRTYVDLKDKWKTLVHTARISPQQRRGEPVPQELLDRVLDAHAYWSQQQAKLQGNKQQTEQGMLL